MKRIKTILLWVLALQILNMSIYCEAYWSSYNNSMGSGGQPDPTETFIEWLVESTIGQQSVFTYDHNNIDSKNVVKPMAFPIAVQLREEFCNFTQIESVICFHSYTSRLLSRSREVLSPPPICKA